MALFVSIFKLISPSVISFYEVSMLQIFYSHRIEASYSNSLPVRFPNSPLRIFFYSP